MTVRAKLFVWIGALLILLTIVLFFLTSYLVQKDIGETAKKIQTLLTHEQDEIEAQQKKVFLETLIKDARESLISLELLFDTSAFARPEGKALLTVQQQAQVEATRLLMINPLFQIAQVHYPKEGVFATLSLRDKANHYVAAEASFFSKNWAKISLINQEDDEGYLGFRLPSFFLPSSITYWGLIPWKKEYDQNANGLLEEYNASIEHIEGKSLNFLPYAEAGGDENIWRNMLQILSTLAPYWGLKQPIEQYPKIPPFLGGAKINADGTGIAIINKELFRQELLLNEEDFLKEAQQKRAKQEEEFSPLGLILDPPSLEPLMIKVVEEKGAFFTAGVSLGKLFQHFASATRRTVVLRYEGEIVRGYDSTGEPLSKESLNALTALKQTKRASGQIQFKKDSYHFSHWMPLDTPSFEVFILNPQKEQTAINKTLRGLDKEITSRISYQILILLALFLALTLWILDRVASGITRPLNQLANATKDIGEGKYEDIVLPDIKEGHDEIASLSKAFEQMIKEIKERENVRAVLNKVVSKDVADEILKSTIHLGGEDRVVTMLFSDIRGFTALSRELSPQKTISLLNQCMTKMSRIIEGEGGVIDKYVGDEIMALFGAPTTHPDNAIRALSAAKLMIETLRKWNEELRSKGEKPIEMGIGVHTGLVVAGNMGAEDRLNYTVLGANVNLAARLCQSAKPLQILISEATLKEPNVKESFYVQQLEPITLKGFDEPVNIYEIVGFRWEDD